MKGFFLYILSISSLISFAQHGTVNWQNPPFDFRSLYTLNTNIKQWPYSNIAVTFNNKRVIMFEKVNGINIGIYLTYSYDGINWSVPFKFIENIQSNTDIKMPKLKGDKNGYLHFVWHSNNLDALFYTKMDTSFNLIIDTVRIAQNSNHGVYVGSNVTIDKKNRIHIIWHEGDNINQSEISEAFYCKSTNNGYSFSQPVMISENDGKNSAWPWAEYSAYNGDSLIIAWRNQIQGDNWDIQYVLSSNGGNTWSSVYSIDYSTGYQADPDIVISPDGRFHVFTHETPYANTFHTSLRVYHRYSDNFGLSWSLPKMLSNDDRSILTECSRFDISSNTLWTFFQESGSASISGDLMAVYSLDNGITWSSPEYMTDEDTIVIGQKGVEFLTDGRPIVNYEVPNGLGITLKYSERISLPSYVEIKNPYFEFNIYPNPTSGHLYIESNLKNNELIIIDLYNSFGSGVIKNKVLFDNYLNLNNLDNGLYNLIIKKEKDIYIKKILIIK